MTDNQEKRLLEVAEATALTMAISELITRIESETTSKNADLAIDTLKYLLILKHKYQGLAICPMTIINGEIVPIIENKEIK